MLYVNRGALSTFVQPLSDLINSRVILMSPIYCDCKKINQASIYPFGFDVHIPQPYEMIIFKVVIMNPNVMGMWQKKGNVET